MLGLLEKTNAYKVIRGDKEGNTLSHAYLIECVDEGFLRFALKSLAKLIVCAESQSVCDNCRACKLIERETHPDVSIYPPAGEKLNSKMAEDICENTLIKPLELDKRIFIVSGFDKFNKNQNKLLKTLEEPPENVVLLIGTSNIGGVLQTVKSRSKKLDILPFSDKALFDEFSLELNDEERLKNAIALSSGMASMVKKNYEGSEFEKMQTLALSLLDILNSSRDLSRGSELVKGVDIKAFISVLKMVFSNVLRVQNGAISRLSNAQLDSACAKYKMGAVVEIIEGLGELERALYFNANAVMVIDKLLFLLLEAKHKWQKL